MVGLKRLLDDRSQPNPVKRATQEYFGLSLRMHRGIANYVGLNAPKRSGPTHVTVYYGKPFTGKTQAAHALVEGEHGEDDIWSYPGEWWWDYYEQQQLVIIDEFKGSLIKWGLLMKLLDCYQMLVPYKGGFTQFNSPKIAITTNDFPAEWYKPEGHPWEALARRIDDWVVCRRDEAHVHCGGPEGKDLLHGWNVFVAENNKTFDFGDD